LGAAGSTFTVGLLSGQHSLIVSIVLAFDYLISFESLLNDLTTRISILCWIFISYK